MHATNYPNIRRDTAISAIESDAVVREWMGAELFGAYLTHKRSELSLVEGLEVKTQIERYAAAY